MSDQDKNKLHLDRREFLGAGVAAGVTAAAGTGLTTNAQAAPKKGGTLKMGISGANTSDSWDGRTHSEGAECRRQDLDVQPAQGRHVPQRQKLWRR